VGFTLGRNAEGKRPALNVELSLEFDDTDEEGASTTRAIPYDTRKIR
jgi:hypothetical protein